MMSVESLPARLDMAGRRFRRRTRFAGPTSYAFLAPAAVLFEPEVTTSPVVTPAIAAAAIPAAIARFRLREKNVRLLGGSCCIDGGAGPSTG